MHTAAAASQGSRVRCRGVTVSRRALGVWARFGLPPIGELLGLAGDEVRKASEVQPTVSSEYQRTGGCRPAGLDGRYGGQGELASVYGIQVVSFPRLGLQYPTCCCTLGAGAIQTLLSTDGNGFGPDAPLFQAPTCLPLFPCIRLLAHMMHPPGTTPSQEGRQVSQTF